MNADGPVGDVPLNPHPDRCQVVIHGLGCDSGRFESRPLFLSGSRHDRDARLRRFLSQERRHLRAGQVKARGVLWRNDEAAEDS